jgi:hypothetical protein
MTQETKLPNALNVYNLFTIFYISSFTSNLLMNDRSRLSQERVHCIFCGLFWTVFLLRGWTIYYLSFFVFSFFSDIRLFCPFSSICRSSHVSSRLFYPFLFFFPAFSRSSRLFLFMPVQIYEDGIIISSGLGALSSILIIVSGYSYLYSIQHCAFGSFLFHTFYFTAVICINT